MHQSVTMVLNDERFHELLLKLDRGLATAQRIDQRFMMPIVEALEPCIAVSLHDAAKVLEMFPRTFVFAIR